MPDLSRWSDRNSYSPRWSGRASIVAGYLSDCQSVLDIGAGSQILKQYLACEYFPADCFGDGILIDLDTDFSPDSFPPCDGVALAGVLEHIADPVKVIASLGSYGRVWAVSYMNRDKHSERGLISFKTLESAFKSAGLMIANTTMWRHQKVYKLVRA